MMHPPLADLEAGVRALPDLPRDSGRLALIVRRLPDGVRETPERVRLTHEEGVPGDDWSRRPPRNSEAQLAVMRRDVAELIANGQPITVFGDNLFVDFDISAANLPAGTRLKVGEAIVEVTPKPHNGCRKFLERFGADGLRLVQAGATRDQNLRGIYWKVVEAGEVSVGAAIQVIARPREGIVQDRKSLLETIAAFVGLFAAVTLGLSAGAMLAEGAVLVPMWRAMSPDAFLRWYADNAARLLDFYGPLEIAGTVLAIAAAALYRQHRGGGAPFVVAAVLATAILGTFPLYFQQVNASFAAGTIALDRVAAALAAWGAWHWTRTAMGVVAFGAAVVGVRGRR